MINTILFDLDGTLLLFSQTEFIDAYFARLSNVFDRLGMDSGAAIKAVWTGTKAMVLNDGSRTNAECFWEEFAKRTALTDERRKAVESACDDFYSNEFDSVKSVMIPTDISKRLVRSLQSKGYDVILATNPLFPACAVTTRLSWIGLNPDDFTLITHYSNSTYCKPNPGYYREIFKKAGKMPEQCLMVGNNPVEDMSAGVLGASTFLVTDCLENETGVDITAFRRGTLAELEASLASMQDISLF